MDALFLTVLNMSLKASYAIIFVIVIRLFLKKIPKIYSYVLWFAVLFRLMCPFSFESIFSLIPKGVNIPRDIAYLPKPEISSGITAIDEAVNKSLPPIVNPAASANPMQIWLAIGGTIWIIGIVILLVYSVFTTVKLYRNLKNAEHLDDNIYIINGYKTPFVFSVVYPKIYLPDYISESEKSYVLLHEQTHIKRLDHIVKLIFFIVTCIHWFNPLVWIAFYLMGEDMELSCDENVVKQMGNSIKKEYSSSLLSMATGKRTLGGSPIAFGENNTEARIKNVLNYKKPTLWILIVVSMAIVIFIIGLTTNPKLNEVIEVSDEQEIIEIENLVKSFGDNIKLVSLTAPEDIIKKSLKENYGEFISLTLLGKWQKDSANAPGRVTSSPWPERIDIVSFEKLSDTEYALSGNIIEVTNVELISGETAATYPVKLNIKKVEGKWLIDDLTNDEITYSQESFEKISAYLEEVSINAFSLYYELLDFVISDYKEELVKGNVEAIFSYTIIHKNYDKDPDTVQYIKEAKERGDKNYKIYYDEYLQPKDMNFYFKAVIDEHNIITLYTKNPSIETDEWRKVEMSDFVIGEITKEHESEKINHNEPIENDIAEYISYDYEYRSIYIAGLKIFEEFGTEEFGFKNEGSVRIINGENALEFFITVSTGPVPAAGTITGPEVYFKMDLGTNKIVEKKFTPAPNYAEIAKLYPEHINPDSIQYSEKIIDLSDERISEIGLYFKEFILETESKFDYFTYVPL